MSTDLRTIYLRDIRRTYANYKTLGERALEQVADDDLGRMLDQDSNSIAIIVKHMAGNFRSRFTDFLTTDGEKPDRDRDTEFELRETLSREQVLDWWNAGWSVALTEIDALGPEDLDRAVYIRGEAFVVVEALDRLAAHAAYHVGQIVLLAKHFAGAKWKSLSIPKGQSAHHAHGTFKQGIVGPRS